MAPTPGRKVYVVGVGMTHFLKPNMPWVRCFVSPESSTQRAQARAAASAAARRRPATCA